MGKACKCKSLGMDSYQTLFTINNNNIYIVLFMTHDLPKGHVQNCANFMKVNGDYLNIL